MTMNDQSDEQAKQLPIVKTDVLGRIKIDPSLIYRMYNIILNYIINHGMDIETKYQDLINAGEPIIEVEESLD